MIRKINFNSAILLFLLIVFGGSSLSPASEKTRLEKQYEAHVWQMINEETSDFYYEMVYKEKFLTLLMNNLIDELKDRKKSGEPVTQIFDAVLTHSSQTKSDSLIQAYSGEIQRVLNLMDQLRRLEKEPGSENGISIRARADKIKEELKKALEEKTTVSLAHSNKISKNLISEYREEIRQILEISKKLAYYKTLARQENNQAALAKIGQTKKYLEQALSSPVSKSESSFESQYYLEMRNVASLLYQLDQFHARVSPDQEDIRLKIDALKEEVLANVNPRLLRVLG
ncbi:MAG TPA: hypothetical protein ENH09_03260, partial [Bacteroidetes bacterium]|nr:hypothetical protein [Bacteroidota bacterium]